MGAFILGIGAKVWIDRIDDRAVRVSETGSALNGLLKDYARNLKMRRIDTVLSDYYDDAFENDPHGKWTEQPTSTRDGVSVGVWQASSSSQPATLRDQVTALVSPFEGIDWAKFTLSQFEQTPTAQTAVIRGVLQQRGEVAEGGSLESQQTFRMTFTHSDGAWRIFRQELLDGWSVRGPARKWFVDVTAKAGIDFRANHNPMLDEPEWRPMKYETARYAGTGVAAADYDNDGWYDIYFSDGARPALYRNRGDGSFQDVTQLAGLPANLPGVQVALFADLDDDGNRDLILGRQTGNNFLYRNNGDGTFADLSSRVDFGGPWVTAATAADYDNDGLLDLYLGRYLDPRTELPTTLFYTRNGEGNTLLRNEGDFRFSDVTQQAGLRDGGITFAMAWADYDQDADQDVYVVNDFGRNALFRNNADGTFTDVARQSGTLDIGYGMSASFADVDNDGDFDIYVSNVHSGQRWFGHETTFQKYCLSSIRQGTIGEDFGLLREVYDLRDGDLAALGMDVVRGNTLLLNNADGTFEDISESSHANPFGWYWGSAIYDFDNDGRQDIYAVNGWISGPQPDDM